MREFGLGKVQPVVLSVLTRNAQAALVETSNNFDTITTKSISLTFIFQVGSEEGLEILTSKAKMEGNPKLKLHTCVLLPKHIAMALLEMETAEIFFVAKEAITSRLLSMTHEDEDTPRGVEILPDTHFTMKTVEGQGGSVLKWILSSLEDDGTTQGHSPHVKRQSTSQL